ncbi:alpha/beta hydrolase [Chitinophaga horti]|uniref:Alpha/beta hydrolase n=1 Tax=Chitinophaga horti TaxID=2920382 RepID=A0ABY6J6Z0_9BACT|nr:alpha/beta hydrolase [Chitinophaga horti]UYQ95436.1 alpha/beta hydrolase [Chitinophaga horti]
MNAQKGQYAQVNGLNMYYEIHGEGFPLVLIHGGGSTIGSNFGHILPLLSRQHRVIAVEMQAHGHTADIDRAYSFEQDADDVAELLRQLKITKANVFGFSNGGTTTLQVAIRHPQLVNKLVVASANYRRDGMPPGFFEQMPNATIEQLPKELADAFRAINPDPAALSAMFNRDKDRMVNFKDIPDSVIQRIVAPTLILNGDQDVVSSEHAVALSCLLPNARLAILPAGHGDYLAEDNALSSVVVSLVGHFLQ